MNSIATTGPLPTYSTARSTILQNLQIHLSHSTPRRFHTICLASTSSSENENESKKLQESSNNKSPTTTAPTSTTTATKAKTPPNSRKQDVSQSYSPWSTSSWPRRSNVPPPVCRECGGRRVIKSTAGLLPCPSCISWQQRPDYIRGQPLLSVTDMNFKNLDSSDDDDDDNKQTTLSDDALRKKANHVFIDDSIANNSTNSQDPRYVMTEQKRLAIKMAMQGRGPLDSDHKRRISNAMRQRYARDPSLRQSGVPKRCSYCKQEGHNRRKCPELYPELKNMQHYSKVDSVLAKIPPKKQQEQQQQQQQGLVRTCSLCGEIGHNKRSCPRLESPSVVIKGKEQTSPATMFVEIINKENSFDDVVSEKTPSVVEGRAIVPSTPTKQQEQEQVIRNVEEEWQTRTQKPLVSQPTMMPSVVAPIMQQPTILTPLSSLTQISVTADGSLVFSLPSSPDQCVAQAAQAVVRAWSDGIRRQALELLLPQSGSDSSGAWPGGIRQQFRAALPMVESLLLQLKETQGLEGRITAEWLDEGDCVGAWQSERLAAVVFPTADSLDSVRRIDDALSGKRLMLVLNPQWQPQGQIVSDFGFGRSRRSAERYVSSLEEVYYLRRVRVLGDEVRVLRCYPSKWQVFYVRSAGQVAELLSVENDKPTYQRLLELLQGVEGTRASKSWLDRALDRGWFDDIAAYKEGGKNGSTMDNAVDAVDVDDDDGKNVVRDIVTGEIVRIMER